VEKKIDEGEEEGFYDIVPRKGGKKTQSWPRPFLSKRIEAERLKVLGS